MSHISISNFSRKLLVLFWLSMIFSIVLNTGFWFAATMFNVDWFNSSFPIEVTLPLSTTRSLLGYFPSMISTMLTVALLWQLIVLFRLYDKGIIFERKNTECFKRLSYLLIATPFVELLKDVLLSLVLSYHDTNWNVSLEVDDNDVTMMVIGFVVRVIAVVMERAAELKEENELTI